MRRAVVLPEDGCLAALAGLAGMGPRQLTALLGVHDEPSAAWAAVVAGAAADDPTVAAVLGRDPIGRAGRWAAEAGRIEPAQLLARHRAAGVTLLTRWHPGWPPPGAAPPAGARR